MSGIEAVTVAWKPLAFRPAWFAEIDIVLLARLAHRYPDVPNLGNFTTIKKLRSNRRSGRRNSCQFLLPRRKTWRLEDARGNLASSFAGLLADCGLGGSVWENVPGVLSSNGGRDLAPSSGAGETRSTLDCIGACVSIHSNIMQWNGGMPPNSSISCTMSAGPVFAARRGELCLQTHSSVGSTLGVGAMGQAWQSLVWGSPMAAGGSRESGDWCWRDGSTRFPLRSLLCTPSMDRHRAPAPTPRKFCTVRGVVMSPGS